MIKRRLKRHRRTHVLASFALVLGSLVINPAASAAAITCNGVPATIVGGPGDDVLPGTAGPDVIAGLGGNDTIDALGGDDIVCGGPGHDTVDAGAGNDVVFGGPGADWIDGGPGDDDLRGQRGNDRITGNGGNDAVSGGDGADELWGEREDCEPWDCDWGDDELTGGAGNDFLNGGPGSDEARGGGGNDNVQGGTHFDCDFFCRAPFDLDIISGGWGDDVLVAGARPLGGGFGGTTIARFPRATDKTIEIQPDGQGGDTQTATGEGADLLVGLLSIVTGPGDDTVTMVETSWPASVATGPGNDTITATGLVTPGPGDDIITGGHVILPAPVDHVVNLEAGFATGEGYDTLVDVCGATTGAGNDVLLGSDSSDVLVGGDGDDEIRGRAGSDLLIGGMGSDVIDGGPEDGFGQACSRDRWPWYNQPSGPAAPGDMAFFPDAVDHVVDLVDGTSSGAGNDTLLDIEHVTTGPGDDIVLGDASHNTLAGGLGNDEIRGRGGDDRLIGDPTPGTVETCDPIVDPIPGNDVIYGGPGNDWIIGAPGDDLLFGGPGDDYLASENGECPGLSDYLPSENVLRGGPGNDFLDGWGGTDLIYGGFDHDTCRVEDRRGRLDVHWSCEEFVGF